MELLIARREVSWFFDGAERALGIRGTGFDGGGGGVWDDERCDRLHEARMSVAHRSTVDRFERIKATLMRLPREAVADLRLVYSPFGSSRASWQAQSAFTHEGRQLFALALSLPELAAAYELTCAKKEQREPRIDPDGDLYAEAARDASFVPLLRFVEDEVARTTIRPGRALPRGHRLEPVLRAAIKRELDAMGLYEKHRVIRETERRHEREERLARSLRDLHIKLWGT